MKQSSAVVPAFVSELGSYRILYTIDDNVLSGVVALGYRRSVYDR